MGDYWVNVDGPLKSCTLHALGCTYEMKKAETDYKGLRRIKRDGGWLPFDNPAAAERHCGAEFSKLNFKKCRSCQP